MHQSADLRYYASGDRSALNRTPRAKGRSPLTQGLPQGPLPHTLILEREGQLEVFRGYFIRAMKGGRAPRMCVAHTLRGLFDSMLSQLVTEGVITLRTSRSLRVQWVEAPVELAVAPTAAAVESGPVTGTLPDALPASRPPQKKVVSPQTPLASSLPIVEAPPEPPPPTAPKRPPARKKVAKEG